MPRKKKDSAGMSAAFTGYMDCRLDRPTIDRLFMNSITADQVMTMIYAAIVDGCKFSVNYVDDTGWCKITLYMLDESHVYAGKMLTSEAESLNEALALMHEKFMAIGGGKMKNLKAAEEYTGRQPR